MPRLELVAELPGHAEPAWSVAWNPARPLLASCSTDKTVRLYSYSLPQTNPDEPSAAPSASLPTADSPKPALQLVSSIPTEHKRTVRSVAWAPGGRTLATASFDSTVGIWEEAEEEEGEWECVTTLEGHENECKSVGFSADGALLASCARDKSVWVWEVQPDADFECIAVMMDHGADVKAVAWHPREEILASASYDSTINIMLDDPDADWGLIQRLRPGLPAADLVLPLEAASQAQCNTSSSNYAALLEALSPTAPESAAATLTVPPLEEAETVWSLAWSPCGRFLASGGDRGGVRIWEKVKTDDEIVGGEEMVERVHSSAHGGPVYALSWTKGDGLGYLASAGGDGRIIVWHVGRAAVANGHSAGDGSVAADAGAEAGAEGADAGETETGAVLMKPVAGAREAHGVADINALAFNVRDDGKGHGMLASCAEDGSVTVWRLVE